MIITNKTIEGKGKIPRVNRPISEVTSRHVISRSGGQASKQIVCVRGPI